MCNSVSCIRSQKWLQIGWGAERIALLRWMRLVTRYRVHGIPWVCFFFLSFFLFFFLFFFVRRRGELFSFFFGSLYFDSKEYSVRSWSVDRRIAYWQPLYHTAKDSFSMTGRLKISYSPLSDLNPLVGNSAKSLLIVRGNGSRGVVMLSDGRLGDERE